MNTSKYFQIRLIFSKLLNMKFYILVFGFLLIAYRQ